MQDDGADPGGCSPNGAPRSDCPGTRIASVVGMSATSGATSAARAGNLRLHWRPEGDIRRRRHVQGRTGRSSSADGA